MHGRSRSSGGAGAAADVGGAGGAINLGAIVATCAPGDTPSAAHHDGNVVAGIWPDGSE